MPEERLTPFENKIADLTFKKLLIGSLIGAFVLVSLGTAASFLISPYSDDDAEATMEVVDQSHLHDNNTDNQDTTTYTLD